MHWFIVYIASLVAFIVIDSLWIALVVRKQYSYEVGDILRHKPQVLAGILFYLLYAAGIVVFAVWPMANHFNGIHATPASYRDVLAWGAGLGAFAYATHTLTNQAVVKDWKYKLVIADILWGAALTALITLLGFLMFRALA